MDDIQILKDKIIVQRTALENKDDAIAAQGREIKRLKGQVEALATAAEDLGFPCDWMRWGCKNLIVAYNGEKRVCKAPKALRKRSFECWVEWSKKPNIAVNETAFDAPQTESQSADAPQRYGGA
jgi:hypothetical protein